MAQGSDSNGALELRTGFGSVVAKGATIYIVVALACLTGLALWEHKQRAEEHENIACLIKMNLYIQAHQLGELNIRKIPSEYWRCLPSNILKE